MYWILKERELISSCIWYWHLVYRRFKELESWKCLFPGEPSNSATTDSTAIDGPDSPVLPTDANIQQETTTVAKATSTKVTTTKSTDPQENPFETTMAEAKEIEATTAITTTEAIVVDSEATIIGGGDEVIGDEEEEDDCTDSSNCQGGSC